MAKQYWNLNQGQQETDTVTGASSGSTAVEVNYDLTKGMTREEVLLALQMIINRIIAGNWPPA